MFQPIRKFVAQTVQLTTAGFATRTREQVKQRKQSLLAIDGAGRFFNELKRRCAGNNPVASANLLHLMKRSKDASDLTTVVKAIAYFQWKGTVFSPLYCSTFVNVCAQVEQPKVAVDVIADPKHHIGAWLSKKATRTLFESLAKTNDIESMLKVEELCRARGLKVQTNESVASMMTAAQAAGTPEQQAAVQTIAEKALSEEGLAKFRSQFPATTAASAEA